MICRRKDTNKKGDMVEDKALDMTVLGMEEDNHTDEEDTEPPL